MVYFEIETDGKTVASFSVNTYDGEPYGYYCEAYHTLSDNAKKLYDEIYLKTVKAEDFSYNGVDAVAAVEAIRKDHPEVDSYFLPIYGADTVEASYYYCWAPYVSTDETDCDIIKNAVSEFDTYISNTVSAIPSGLSGEDRYIYLAQKFAFLYLNEHRHEKEDGIGLLIAGDSENERFAKTYCRLCEAANLYCTIEGSVNKIKIGAEFTEVDVRNSARCKLGSEEWLDTFYKK